MFDSICTEAVHHFVSRHFENGALNFYINIQVLHDLEQPQQQQQQQKNVNNCYILYNEVSVMMCLLLYLSLIKNHSSTNE